MKVSAYAAFSATFPLAPFQLERRNPEPEDVAIEILYCGVCHSDLHTARGEWGGTTYPCVPGHEIIGRVTQVGAAVTKFTAGQLVGVGCLVGSCRTCGSCRDDLEQYCEAGWIGTYNSVDPHSGGITYGGYSGAITVNHHFVLSIPANLTPEGAAPLLCAGITTWSPLQTWEVGPNSRVAVVGLGGLGHMAIKLAAALGAEVTLFTSSPAKVADGKRLGAHSVVLAGNDSETQLDRQRFDLVLDTVSAPHDLNPYLGALERDGVLVLLGVPPAPHPSPNVAPLILGRRRIAGSLIGGLRETQELLDFCGSKRIMADVELIRIQQINEAYERMLRGDVRYRFVIDLASLSE